MFHRIVVLHLETIKIRMLTSASFEEFTNYWVNETPPPKNESMDNTFPKRRQIPQC